jgi:hypothetical protein
MAEHEQSTNPTEKVGKNSQASKGFQVPSPPSVVTSPSSLSHPGSPVTPHDLLEGLQVPPPAPELLALTPGSSEQPTGDGQKQQSPPSAVTVTPGDEVSSLPESGLIEK